MPTAAAVTACNVLLRKALRRRPSINAAISKSKEAGDTTSSRSPAIRRTRRPPAAAVDPDAICGDEAEELRDDIIVPGTVWPMATPACISRAEMDDMDRQPAARREPTTAYVPADRHHGDFAEHEWYLREAMLMPKFASSAIGGVSQSTGQNVSERTNCVRLGRV